MLLARNRRAYYDYEIIEKFIAGIVLKGYEVKALREKKANFDGSYITIRQTNVFVENLHIGAYSRQSQEIGEQDTRKPRKLLLNKREIQKLRKELEEKGKTAVPLALILKNNMVKLELAVVKGKKQFGKKQTEKERQMKKDMELEAKEFKRF
ncbi:SsrA-binding protein [candidate division WWE3 bacterium RIFCSPHIGHO2_01_FULL_42_13]|uniref:SsrA-binding protein n=1 Tax=candidate division WWE3 bacterium RIFCSPHIGHO2_01_FULL_42_13 TaxID=1802617 RepID=A0A1F4US82_UNCKA|nr:MAG: SsrA-binding protein [candidate division WWE3 bacterium RIFCSPHIGHO2_01_FULL_42_13]